MNYYVNVVAKHIYVVLGDGLVFSWTTNKQGRWVWSPVFMCIELIKVVTNIGPLSIQDLEDYCRASGTKIPDRIQDDGEWEEEPA